MEEPAKIVLECTKCNRSMYKYSMNPPKGSLMFGGGGMCIECSPNISGTKRVLYDSEGQVCTKCLRYHPYENYNQKLLKSITGYSSWCSRCHALYKFNLSLTEYEKILEDQGGVCAICKSPPDTKDTAMPVDHDHSCCPGNRSCGKCIRGILCRYCNSGIGYFKDSITVIESAIHYIKENRIEAKSN